MHASSVSLWKVSSQMLILLPLYWLFRGLFSMKKLNVLMLQAGFDAAHRLWFGIPAAEVVTVGL
jgi:hypothetical protein